MTSAAIARAFEVVLPLDVAQTVGCSYRTVRNMRVWGRVPGGKVSRKVAVALAEASGVPLDEILAGDGPGREETTGYQTESYRPGDPPSISNNLTGRDLLTPDEIMQLRPENQILRVQGPATAVAQKLRYYADREFDGLFVPQDH